MDAYAHPNSTPNPREYIEHRAHEVLFVPAAILVDDPLLRILMRQENVVNVDAHAGGRAGSTSKYRRLTSLPVFVTCDESMNRTSPASSAANVSIATSCALSSISRDSPSDAAA